MQPSKNKKKIKYKPPQAIQLEESKYAKGACENGTSDLDTCDTGSNAAGGCLNGIEGFL